ncbi:MAG: 3-deoxy-manno-octulosonate cytidylyltransferase [Gammaproteobacteria bacterium]|jgi:3-deoxy-manno-octulosonate cytidylyltransferase (CMP-KDO synthetase)|nr:3-deoxy-manno-octulosonate cytidylyltransferase [Gammaproteobacteria bacterium]
MARRIIIPARYASSRLPGKPLLDIGGKPMLQHVYELALRCRFDSVVIATDDKRIFDFAESLGAKVCMTDPNHPTGTDRAAEVMRLLGYEDDDIIIGLQGDEPLIPISNVIQVADNLEQNPDANMATLCERMWDLKDIMNPNMVKVTFDIKGYALYFSRAPIPWARESFPHSLPAEAEYFLHVGIYGYRGSFLRHYSELASAPIERCEALEQLRVLWHGGKIHVDIAKDHNPPGVNTAEDLELVRKLFHP